MAYRETDKTKVRKAEQREKILRAAHRIVAENGFRAASIASVAGLSGIATGTVYKYFPSKSDLLAEVFRRATEREVNKVSEAMAVQGSERTKLASAIQVFADRAISGRMLAWALIAEPIDPAVDEERLKYRQAYAKLFQRLLEQGVQSGAFSPQNPAISAAAIVGAISEALVGPLSPIATTGTSTPPIDKERLIADIHQFCLNAVSPNAPQAH